MKIVVIGGTGLIGSKTIPILRQGGHRSRRMGPPLIGKSSILTNEGDVMRITLVAMVLLCLMSGTAMAQESKVTSLMSKDIPESPGKEMLMILVEHAPGGSSPIHRHYAHAMVYVLEGSVVMQVKGGKQVTLTPGQSFYEAPDDIHVVDRNASSTKSAKSWWS